MQSLHRPDSVFIYSVYSSWGRGVDYFISFQENNAVAGIFINNDVLFKALAGRGLLERDSLDITKTLIDTSITFNEILQFIRKYKILELPDEGEIMLLCGDSSKRDVGSRNPAFNIDDGVYNSLLKLTGSELKVKEYYEIHEVNKWCPVQKEYQLLVQLDQLFQQHFPSRAGLIKGLIEEYRQRKIRKRAKSMTITSTTA